MKNTSHIYSYDSCYGYVSRIEEHVRTHRHQLPTNLSGPKLIGSKQLRTKVKLLIYI